EEEDRALQHADQKDVLAGVVGRDLLGELADPVCQLVRLDEDLSDLGGGGHLGRQINRLHHVSSRSIHLGTVACGSNSLTRLTSSSASVPTSSSSRVSSRRKRSSTAWARNVSIPS